MSLIDYMKREMKIRRPFLYLLTAALSLMVGWGSMYMLEGRKVTKLREQISELNIKIVETRQEYEKRLKDKSRTISIQQPDGTVTTEIFNDISSEETGTVMVNATELSKRLRLTDVDYGSKPWLFKFNYSPSNPLAVSDVINSKIGVEIGRDIGNFYLGVPVEYDFKNDKWWIGLSLGVRF